MRKAVFASLFVAVLLAVAVIAEAQQPKKVYRIGYLSALDPATDSVRVEGIRLALRERGYIEGQNIVVEYRLDRRYAYAGAAKLGRSIFFVDATSRLK